MRKDKFNKKCFVSFLTLLSTTCLSINGSEKINDQKVESNNQLFAKVNDKKMEINFKIPTTSTNKPTAVIVHAYGYADVNEENKIYNSNYSEDYGMLTNMLVEKGFKTAVISRLGYGKSDDSESPRTNENIAKEMSSALKQANINPPYILIGHSMGNLFCLEWIKSNEKDILGYVGLDGTNPYYFRSTPLCPELLEDENRPKFLTDGIYGEWSYQNQNMWNLHGFKFPEKMPVRMFLSKQLQDRSNEILDGWTSDTLKKVNEDLFSNTNNQKIICLEDEGGGHFIYRSKPHAEMIVNEIENLIVL